MPQLTNKNMVVIGGGGGAGRRIVRPVFAMAHAFWR